jgi:FtsP/CotA-like multicopper oxidase with cupredoxin domain
VTVSETTLPMLLTRRRVLSAGIAVTAFAAAGPRNGARAAESDGFRVLRARPGTAALRGADNPPTPIWGYDGLVPGPTLRYRRGEEVKVRLVNELPEPTSVHWHGVRLANAMDGTPLTQAPIPPGGSFDYRFTPPDAGTYWYHPHINGSRQLGRGLSGVLIIDEAAPVMVDRDVALVLADWPRNAAGAIDAANDGSEHLTVNGQSALDIPVRGNERLRLRLINAARARPFTLRLDQHRAFIMAIDGEPAEPFVARDSRLVLGPGNRIDLIVDLTLAPGSSAALLAEVPGGTVPLARLVYEAGAPARPSPFPDPMPLPANRLPERMDLRSALRLDLHVEGGATSGTEIAAKPLFSVKRGRTVTLALMNRAASASVVHVHGHSVRLLDSLDDGWKPFWLDTIMVPGQQTLRIAFVADNPGKWMLDGLNLGSSDAGVPMWFEVL